MSVLINNSRSCFYVKDLNYNEDSLVIMMKRISHYIIPHTEKCRLFPITKELDKI